MTSTTLAPYMSPEVAELFGWIERLIAEGATRFALRQKSDESGETLVRDFSIQEPTSAHHLANSVWQRAQDDGRHLRGRTLYGLFAYRDRDYIDRTFFTVQGVDDQTYGSRDATLGSVTGQLMRHNEANARLAIGQTLDVIGHYKALLVAREKRIEELEEKYLEVLKLYEQLTSMKHQRELELAEAAKADKTQDYLKEKFDMLVPLIMSKLAGSDAGKKILAEEMLTQFLGSLTPQQRKALMGMLGPEQFALINEIYLAYGEREEAKKQKSGKKPNGSNGARASNGGNGAGHA